MGSFLIFLWSLLFGRKDAPIETAEQADIEPNDRGDDTWMHGGW